MDQFKTPHENSMSPYFGMGLCSLFVMLGLYLYFIKAPVAETGSADNLRLGGISFVTFFGLFFLMSLIRLIRKA